MTRTLNFISDAAFARIMSEPSGADAGMTPEQAERLAGPAPTLPDDGEGAGLDNWQPAPGERCCGTCQHLREDKERGLSCHLDPQGFIGARWWGTACAMWTGPQSIPVECANGCEDCATCKGNPAT